MKIPESLSSRYGPLSSHDAEAAGSSTNAKRNEHRYTAANDFFRRFAVPLTALVVLTAAAFGVSGSYLRREFDSAGGFHGVGHTSPSSSSSSNSSYTGGNSSAEESILVETANFEIVDETIAGAKNIDDALRMKVLRNPNTEESFGVIWESGGTTHRLRLLSPRTGEVRDVLRVHWDNVADDASFRESKYFAGSLLVPYANRVRDGTYNFAGQHHSLDKNECVEGLRCGALHGYLHNRPMKILGQDVSPTHASLTLGYEFEGTDTPGWPFRASAEVTYTLSAGKGAGGSSSAVTPNPGVATITVRITNKEKVSPIPLTVSWHPYFIVSDVSRTEVRLDTCGMGLEERAWQRVVMGEGAPRGGDLIPTGQYEPWPNTSFVIGGVHEHPTYMDDEFVATLSVDDLSKGAGAGPSAEPCSNTQYLEHSIVDKGGDGDISILFADRSKFRVAQLFTGAREGWGWNALALEPMSGLADAYNNEVGLTVLGPKETFEGTFGVTLR